MKRRRIEKIKHAEKIAAGEVVERPANIVKELVENSIDAGAKEIRVIVKRAGKTLIQVIDDGVGIPPDEIEFAFERHTSSKIRSIEDLDTLSTLGFRGEALTSIAAVSQVEIKSRSTENNLGIYLIIDGGKVVSNKEISCPVGTDIKVKNIFYNIPARQKFLKSDTTELGHITDIIQRYALAFPQIHFIYRHKDLDILNCPASNDLKTTVFHIYGKKIAKFMEVIDFKEDKKTFKVHGLLGHPQIAKKNRTSSSLYINHRYIISDVLFRAIKEAYEGTLMIGKFPFFIVFLELDPSVIDFNVHPKKLHIRFEDDEFIYNRIYNIIRKFIEDKFIAKEAKYIEAELGEFISPVDTTSNDEEATLNNLDLNRIKVISREEEYIIEDSIQLNLMEQVVEKKIGKVIPESFLREKYIIAENFPKLRLISSTGQLSNNIYVVLEGFNENGVPGLYILDQHAASERINKEFFLNMYESSKISKQQLISPLKIEVTPSEKFFLEENIREIKKIGFNFEHFGGNTFILRDIPTIMGKIPDSNLIKEIISDITDIGKDKSFSEVKEQIINYIACHRSIRGGDKLTLKDIRSLLNDLANCKDSYHCAHGRPTLRFISFKELDKLFKRIV
jgi:DNA mismatch repair protein MutL